MTYGSLLLMFVSSGIMALGVLALIIGFFLGLLYPKRLSRASLLFLLGVVAVIAGALLMRPH